MNKAAAIYGQVSVTQLSQALRSVRAIRNTLGRARTAAKRGQYAQHYELAHRLAISSYLALDRVSEYLKAAGLDVPGVTDTVRGPPMRPRSTREYGRTRSDGMFRCVFEECGNLCWKEAREEHVWFEHRLDMRGSPELLDGCFTLAEEQVFDELDDEDAEGDS